jgi:hypothetical protein
MVMGNGLMVFWSSFRHFLTFGTCARMDALTSLLTYASTITVTVQLGFDSAIKYVECHGWTFCNKGREANIRYHKLEQVISKLTPTKQVAELAMNFNAMINHLYELVESKGIKNI